MAVLGERDSEMQPRHNTTGDPRLNTELRALFRALGVQDSWGIYEYYYRGLEAFNRVPFKGLLERGL